MSILVGSVAVEVVPDATGFRERLDADLRDFKVDVKVNVETGEAIAKVAALRAELDAAGSGAGGGGGSSWFQGIADSAAGASESISGVAAAALALAPALLPIAAVGAAGMGALAAGFAAVASGAVVAVLALHGVSAAVKAMDQADAASAKTSTAAALQRLTDAQSIAAAAQQVTSAQQGVVQAEQGVTTAVYNERQAQLSLIDARKAAQRQLESYSQQLADGALAARQDQLAVDQAAQALRQTLRNPASTLLQRQEAQLAYDQAVQQQKDQSANYKNLQEDAAAAAKAGIDGNQAVVAASHQVTAAQQAVIQSHQQVTTATSALQRAQANVATTNERVALTAQQATTANQALATAMSNLSPAGQAFATWVHDTLRPAFEELTGAAQTGFLPGLQSALQDLLPILPTFTGLVSSLAGTLGNLAKQGASALRDPFWTNFVTFVKGEAGPTLEALFKGFGSIAEGLAGLAEAFAPVTSKIFGSFDGLAQKFATFATNTTPGSPLERFVAFVQQALPVVGTLLDNLGKAVAAIAKAGAGQGLSELKLISDFAGLIAKIPEPILAGILAVLPPLILAVKGFGLAVAIAKVAIAEATPVLEAFGLTIEANPLALIIEVVIAAVVGLGIAIYELVMHWSAVWDFLKNVAQAGARDVVNFFLGMADDILIAADKAFSWIPGIGDKLKSATDAFRDFKTTIDASLGDKGAQVALAGAGGAAGTTALTGLGKLAPPEPNSGRKIPVMGEGGYVDHPTFAWLAEAGPELVLPLSKPARMQELMGQTYIPRMTQGPAMSASGMGAGGGLRIDHLEVKGQPTPLATASETVREFRKAAYLVGR